MYSQERATWDLRFRRPTGMTERKLPAYAQSEKRLIQRSLSRKALPPSYFGWATDALRLTNSTAPWIMKGPAAPPRRQSRLPHNNDETYREAHLPMDSKCAESRSLATRSVAAIGCTRFYSNSYSCGHQVSLGSGSHTTCSLGPNSYGAICTGRLFTQEFHFPGESEAPSFLGRSLLQESGHA